jgi:hypothetical protein
LPAVKSKTLTEPKPFDLSTEKRGHLHQAHFQEKLEKELEEVFMKKNFVANPIPELEPFVPKKSDKPVVMPEPILLRTDLRSQERQDFEEQLKLKQREEEEAKENMRRVQMVHMNFKDLSSF